MHWQVAGVSACIIKSGSICIPVCYEKLQNSKEHIVFIILPVFTTCGYKKRNRQSTLFILDESDL
jgi:hypothetical protein